MKKVLIVFFILALLIAAFFVFKGCEPRQKPQEGTTEEPDYRNAFIEASIDFTCKLKRAPLILDDENLTKSELNISYESYGLPVDDNQKMIEILTLYENDEEILGIIKANTTSCE
ncbi:MAG: hypothetical protein V1679_02885 [Candidatus Peregrinibacteria bacterium]